MSREHWLFRYPDGCSFAVMDKAFYPSEPGAWFESFGSATRVRAARDAGVIVELVTSEEWDAKHRATFGRICDGPHPKLPEEKKDGIDDLDLEQHALEHAVENEMHRLHEKLGEQIADPDSLLGKQIATVIDRLRPDLSPFDRRAAIEAITNEIQTVVANA